MEVWSLKTTSVSMSLGFVTVWSDVNWTMCIDLCLCALPFVQDNQKDLENATEQLSEYLERDITSDMLFDIKQKVQDKSRSVHSSSVSFYLLTRNKEKHTHTHTRLTAL